MSVMRLSRLILILSLVAVFPISCAGNDTGPYIPTDPPTADELANLLGEWEGLTETNTGLLDLLTLEFYQRNNYIRVTVYLNNTYVDEAFVDYDGDRVRFYTSNFLGDYAEFDGYIDHNNLIYSGSFFVQFGISTRSGTFLLYKK